MAPSREYVLTISVLGYTLLTGCFFPPPDLEVQVIHYPGFEHRESRGEACEDVQTLNSIRVLAVDELRPKGCRQIGDVFIGDSSTSYPCEPEDLIARLRGEFPETVLGIKDSSGDWSNMQAILDRFPGFELFTGSERFLLDTLRHGGAGTISAAANQYTSR